MSINDLVSFLAPFIFTGIAIYLSLLLTKLNTKVNKQKAIYVWVAISVMYILFPYVASISEILPYTYFIIPMIIMFVFARFYWKITVNQAIIFALCYGVVNVVTVIALGFLLAGVFSSPSTSTTY